MSPRDETTALVRVLRLAGALAFVLALPGVALGAPSGLGPSWAMVVVLVIAPLARVAWLATRWARVGDRRFATAGALLLVLTAVGGGVAFLTR